MVRRVRKSEREVRRGSAKWQRVTCDVAWEHAEEVIILIK